MREVDRLTTERYGIPSILLMENAAHATARIIAEKLGGSVEGKKFLILCGKGNNGGDGAALARILWTQGANCFVYLFGKIEGTKGDAKANFEIIKKIDESEETNAPNDNCLILFEDSNADSTGVFHGNGDVIVDGLFGTGLSRPIGDDLKTLIRRLAVDARKLEALLVSLDLPSGLDADKSDSIGESVSADLTITFTAPKLANVVPPVSNFNGELHIANIGSPQELIDSCESKTFLAETKDAKDWLSQTKFLTNSYKNKRGNALLIVGSKNYSGAAVLVGNSAMVSGVGLVTVATSESAQESVSKRVLSEVITQGLAETKNGAISENAFEKIRDLTEKVDVLTIGSGLSSDEETTRRLVRKVVENRKTPIVIDADGLNSLSPFDLQGSDEMPLILTPHEGEFLRLMGTNDKSAIKNRLQAVRDFSTQHKVILVLKGERTLIGDSSGKVVINPTGNSGLGKAGNGDNLNGVITGFIAQAIQFNTDIFGAVIAAVYIAGLAGGIAEKKLGKRAMLASDVRECLVEAFREVKNE